MKSFLLALLFCFLPISAISFGNSGGAGSSGPTVEDITPSAGWGFGGDDGGGSGVGGGDGCGGCESTSKFVSGFVQMLAITEKEDSMALLDELSKKSILDLRVERAAGRVCVINDCNDLDPALANSLVDMAIADLRQFEIEKQYQWDFGFQVANIVLFLFSVLIAGGAFWHGAKADRRSAVNETRLDTIQGEKP